MPASGEEVGRGTVNGGPGRERKRVEIEAPYLQLVLTRLWDEERATGSRTLRLSTLTRLGGAEEIVRTHLDKSLGGLPEDERETAADIFRHLVTPTGAKIVHSVPDLAQYSGHSDADVSMLLDKLAAGDARIVRQVPSPAGEDAPARFEIYHDLLATAILDWRNRQESVRLQGAKELAEREARAERARAGRFRWLAVGAGLLLLVAIGLVVYALGQPASVVKSQVVTPRAHGALVEPVKINDKVGNGRVTIKTEGPLDADTRQVTQPRGGTGGWHKLAGPHLTIVTQGTLTIIDAKCKRHDLPAGHANFVSGASIDKTENLGSTPVVWYVTFLLPHAVKSPSIPAPAPAGCKR